MHSYLWTGCSRQAIILNYTKHDKKKKKKTHKICTYIGIKVNWSIVYYISITIYRELKDILSEVHCKSSNHQR